MRTVLVLAAALLARTAAAQPGGPADPAPQPTAPPPGPPGETPPVAPPPTEPAPPEAPPRVDPDYGATPDDAYEGTAESMTPGIRRGRDIVVRYTPSRSKKNITTIAVMGGLGLVAGAVGFYFHRQYSSDSDAVSAKTSTGRTWTADYQTRYDDAKTNSTVAGVTYGIGGALVLATAIYYIATEPEQQEIVITPNTKVRTSALPAIVPTQGGAMLGGAWSF